MCRQELLPMSFESNCANCVESESLSPSLERKHPTSLEVRIGLAFERPTRLKAEAIPRFLLDLGLGSWRLAEPSVPALAVGWPVEPAGNRSEHWLTSCPDRGPTEHSRTAFASVAACTDGAASTK